MELLLLSLLAGTATVIVRHDRASLASCGVLNNPQDACSCCPAQKPKERKCMSSFQNQMQRTQPAFEASQTVGSLPSHRRLSISFLLALLIAFVGIVVWILNIVGVIPGPWSSIFGAIFTVSGVVLTLPQLLPLHQAIPPSH